jgi:hypothetical protein
LRLGHLPRPEFNTWVFYIYVCGYRLINNRCGSGIRPAKTCLIWERSWTAIGSHGEIGRSRHRLSTGWIEHRPTPVPGRDLRRWIGRRLTGWISGNPVHATNPALRGQTLNLSPGFALPVAPPLPATEGAASRQTRHLPILDFQRPLPQATLRALDETRLKQPCRRLPLGGKSVPSWGLGGTPAL